MMPMPESMIEYHLYKLEQAGIKEVIINTAWLGEQIQQTLGNGEQYNLNIQTCYQTTTCQ